MEPHDSISEKDNRRQIGAVRFVWDRDMKMLSATCLLLLNWGVAAAITPESLGQAAPLGSAPKVPTIYIAESVGDVNKFKKLLTDADRNVLATVDFESRIVVAVFRGVVSSNGFAITILKIAPEQQYARVTVKLADPPPNSNVRFGFTNPYHVVTIPRRELGKRVPSVWVVDDIKGTEIARH
jgi:hypothetical protein